MVSLDRNYDLWRALEAVPLVGKYKRLQVMQGAWGRDSQGARLPDDQETGYLFGDSYFPDAGFKARLVSDLASIPAEGRNKQILDMICAIWPAHAFILIFH